MGAESWLMTLIFCILDHQDPRSMKEIRRFAGRKNTRAIKFVEACPKGGVLQIFKLLVGVSYRSGTTDLFTIALLHSQKRDR